MSEVFMEIFPKYKSLEKAKNSWWIEKILPDRSKAFILVVVSFCLGIWLIGYFIALSSDVIEGVEFEYSDPGSDYLHDHEWQYQPFYLAVHFVILRMFGVVYTRNFETTICLLKAKPEEISQHTRWVFGPVSNFGAFLAAAGFIYYDYSAMLEEGFGALTSLDLLIMFVWGLERIVLGYVICLMLGTVFLIWKLLKSYYYSAPADVVLMEKRYRPFTQFAMEASSLVLVFALVDVVYLYYAGFWLADFLAFMVLIFLVTASFLVSTWIIKSDLKVEVEEQLMEFYKELETAKKGVSSLDPEIPKTDTRWLAANMDLILAFLKIDYLEDQFRTMAASDARVLVLRMLIPIVGIMPKLLEEGGFIIF